ncbi:MAG TPA: response regulator [Verrucomicrobiae bacterium]|jgi:PAS domain S-box-containing protein|nr:response regulator [Verrucomicrobiae bacterium]
MKIATDTITAETSGKSGPLGARALELFAEMQDAVSRHTDTIFARLMVCQWVAAVAAAIWISPRTWAGSHSHIHVHVFAAVFLGGLITALPVFMAMKYPGRVLTRHTVAVGQMLMSALLIHLTGGRIETHFHVFGSLAILAFYRDWRVLISASTVVYIDHLVRGFFWPQSVYGVMTAPIWRSLEHAGWVVFEVTFLLISIRKSLRETLNVAVRQAELENINETIERNVSERTAELTREVSERSQVEEGLKKSEAQLAKAQRIARLGSWEWDVVQNKVTWSDETRRLYGFSEKDHGAEMNRCLERVHPEDRAQVQLALTEALRSGGPYICDHRALLPDGTIRTMHGLGEVVMDERGQPVKIIGTTQDITEADRAEAALRRSEEQLRQSQKMEAVGRLAGGVAHDFNNLLTVISGYSSMSLRQMEKAHPLRKHTEEIQAAAQRAASLTGQLLAFSRKQVLQPRVIDLNDSVSGMEKMLRRLIGEDVELCTLFNPELGNVKADPGQFEQVILNLAVNARDAMPRGGKLTIQTANVALDQKTRFRNRDLDVGEYVMVAITDTGVGMTEEVKSHLFEPFFTTKGVGRGTGLGLATCYGIICQSDGDIRVYSELNCGTTFKVYLPRVDAPTTAADTSIDPDALPEGSESILIVEDEAAVRRLAASVLRGAGYRVQEARDAIEAFTLIESKQPFDLVITDVIMPKMSGKELYDQIKVIAPRINVLFMSGYTDDALAHHGVLGPELSFLEKPFSPAGLARKVREVIDRPKARSRLMSKVASNGNGVLPASKH